jgi:hypothetical protein
MFSALSSEHLSKGRTAGSRVRPKPRRKKVGEAGGRHHWFGLSGCAIIDVQFPYPKVLYRTRYERLPRGKRIYNGLKMPLVEGELMDDLH